MDNNKKHSLGHRAFYFFLSRRLKAMIWAAILVAALWYVERWLPAAIANWWSIGWLIVLAAAVFYICLTLFKTWLEYRFYTYTFTDEAFIMTYGVVVRNEVAALYHQIQNVSIQRGMAERMTGVSRILIFLDGDESGHAKIVLPAVGKKKARLVQKELLVRARRNSK